MMDWLAPLDEMPLAEITPPLARQLRDKAYKSGGYRFANYVLAVLSAALSWGAELGHITENPIRGRIRKATRPKGMPYRNRPWSVAERDLVLKEAPFHLMVPLAIMRWTGLRTGDALSLPRKAYDGTAIEIRTGKTGQLVWLPCPRPLRAILDEALTRNANSTTFAINSSNIPWTGNGFRASLAKFIKKLAQKGKVGPGLSPHGLRHSLAVDLRELGFDERAIADFLGQAEIETARGYARGADLRKKMSTIVERLDN
jgi:integrase